MRWPIERDNPSVKGVLRKSRATASISSARPAHQPRLEHPIGHAESRSKDVLGRVYEYFLSQSPSAEGKKAASFIPPAAW